MVPLVNSAFQTIVQGVDPRTSYDDSEGGRLFLMQVRNLCELDPSDEQSCRPVNADHVFYSADESAKLPKPACCFLAEDRKDGTYAIQGKIPRKGRFTVGVQSLEVGGLWGQYWDNQWMQGVPAAERQEVVDFIWGSGKVGGYLHFLRLAFLVRLRVFVLLKQLVGHLYFNLEEVVALLPLRVTPTLKETGSRPRQQI